MHDPVYFPAYRHVDGQALRNGMDRAGGGPPFDDLMNACLCLARWLSFAGWDNEKAIAQLLVGEGQDEIAQTGEPHEGFAHGAEFYAETHHLGEPARDERHPSVGAEAHAVGDARSDRYDVLDRASDLDSGDIGLRICAEVRSR